MHTITGSNQLLVFPMLGKVLNKPHGKSCKVIVETADALPIRIGALRVPQGKNAFGEASGATRAGISFDPA